MAPAYTVPRPLRILPLLLLLLLLLLLEMQALVVSGCGCWGTHRIYVHYRPPVTGWFHSSPSYNYLYYERVYGAEPQKRQFRLMHRKGPNYWVLSEKQSNQSLIILKTRRFTSTDYFTVSCPKRRCSCQELLVNGSSCMSMIGHYYKRNYTLGRNSTIAATSQRKHHSNKYRSWCLLGRLARCLFPGNYTRQENPNCSIYTQPLMVNSSGEVAASMHSDENVYEMNNYTITKAKGDVDFWFIESEEGVHAVSRNAGPCPDQLAPDSTTWVRTDGSFSFNENINVTCITWDSLSGD